MKPYFSMLEKEWLEHKAITYTPLLLLACVLLVMLSMILNANVQSNISYQLSYNVVGFSSGYLFSEQLSNLVFGFSGVLSILLTSFYFPKTLRKERQEGSLMFWRSMPITDWSIHWVKLAFGLLVTPIFCSILVFSADLFMWLMNLFMAEKLPLFFTDQSILYVLGHWLEFIARMWLIGLALFPFATLAMAISHKVSSPLLVMLIGFYVIKWLSSSLLGTDVISDFLQQVTLLPYDLLIEPYPLSAFTHVGGINLSVYALLGAAGLWLSLRFSRLVNA